jgi:lysozyme
MKPSKKCLDLIKHFEGFFTKSYRCPANVWTIGWGTIRYKNGKKVAAGETITREAAEDELMFEVENKAKFIKAVVNQNQYDALVSFCYNVGQGALEASTLYRKVRANPNDPTIRDEFMKWNKARVNGVLTPLKGLTRRRKAEADLYFSKDV